MVVVVLLPDWYDLLVSTLHLTVFVPVAEPTGTSENTALFPDQCVKYDSTLVESKNACMLFTPATVDGHSMSMVLPARGLELLTTGLPDMPTGQSLSPCGGMFPAVPLSRVS